MPIFGSMHAYIHTYIHTYIQVDHAHNLLTTQSQPHSIGDWNSKAMEELRRERDVIKAHWEANNAHIGMLEAALMQLQVYLCVYVYTHVDTYR